MPNEFPHAECSPTRACVPVLSNYALWFVMRHCLDAHLFICRISLSLCLSLSIFAHSLRLAVLCVLPQPLCLLYGKDCSGKGANHGTGVLPAAFSTPGMWPLNFVIMSLIPPPSPGLVSTFVRLLCHIQQASWSMTQAQPWLKKKTLNVGLKMKKKKR